MKKELSVRSKVIMDRLIFYGKKLPERTEEFAPHIIIRSIRNALRMTQAQLAKRVGLPQSHLAKIETGKVDIQLNTLRRILRAMHCETFVLPKFEKTPLPSVARRIQEVTREHMPLRLVDKEDDHDTLQFWLEQAPQARIEAVEFLREQYYAMSGYKSLPRLAHAIQIRSRQA
jgi:transcriptional regulator with XRE-family HTH domain